MSRVPLRARPATRPPSASRSRGAVAVTTAMLLALPALAPAQEPGPAADTAGPAVDPVLFQDLEYRMIGPTRGGRVTAVAGHPARPLTFYMGATGGGVWKTTDAGATWVNVSDGYFRSPSIGAIRVAPSDPSVVYVGTGSDGIRSNVIAGRGAYRSDDGGETWVSIGLQDAGQIGALEVDPRDPDRVYAAALGHPFGKNEQRGVFRSRDGGATWEKVLFVSDSVGAVDLELAPDDPGTLYAALWRAERKPWTIISGAGPESGDGIWKSTDGGDSWRRLERGLPAGLIGKADLAVTPADPDRVYALVEAPDGEEGLYRSDDRGESWRLVGDERRLMNRPFYFTNVTADPDDADVVYVGNVEFFRSTDGGVTWEERDTPHADNHDLWINPDDPRIMVQGNDGGANVSLDGGESWSTQYNQPTAELYQVDVDDRFPYWAYAGQQDSWTAVAVPGLPTTADRNGFESDGGWFEAVGGCETGPAVPKPGEPHTIFTACKGRFGVYDRRTGQERQYWVGAEYIYGQNPAELEYRFQRVVPVEVSPHDPEVVYHGSQFVHRTSDGGASWETISPDLTANRPERQVVSGGPITRDVTGEEHYSTLYVIEESPLEPGTIWVGANDGPVHVTRDGGATWTDVTPPDMPPEGRINAIEPSPHRPGKAYVAGYRTLLDDWRPYIWRTEDHGATWTLLTDGTNGIPADRPARVVREDPEREGLLYAGTEFGMYVSFDDGARWQPLQLDLPVVPVTDIEVHRGDLVVSTMGRSFWVLDGLDPLREAGPAVASAAVHLYAPRDAYRIRYRAGRDMDGAPVMPEYPPPGAVLDYWLAEGADGPVTLEILDAEGRTVRSYPAVPERTTGSAVGGGRAEMPAGEGATDEAGGDTAATRGAGPEAPGVPLPAERGMHRVVWDLRHEGPWDAGRDVDGDAYGDADEGPLAAPGTYTARLSAGGRTVSRELRVVIDPRVAAAGITEADLEAQLELGLRIRDAIGDARRAAVDAAELRGELGAVAAGGEGEEADVDEAVRRRASTLLDRVREVETLLTTDTAGSYPPPRLIDQLEYLYGMVTAADQRPGRDAFERFETLGSRLEEARSTLSRTRAQAAELRAPTDGSPRARRDLDDRARGVPDREVDVLVYGGTSAGVIAAYAAKTLGKSVLLVEPGRHLGGMTSGGLGQTDIGNKFAVTGLALDFYRRVGRHYGWFEAWQFEPHVAERVFEGYVGEAGVDVLFSRRLAGVTKEGTRIREVELEPAGDGEGDGLVVAARQFIDATYEGDLLAAAGASYVVGREGNEVYGETLNGVQLRGRHQLPDGIDPYVVPGDSSSGLLPDVDAVGVAPDGTGDRGVQAYNFRMCLCQGEDRIPISRPPGYDRDRYELLLRRIAAERTPSLDSLFIISRMPNGKTDWNNRGGVSTDYIGKNWDYPEAGHERRAEIRREHEVYQKGLIHFLGHDPRVPAHLAEAMRSWGYCPDEFRDTGGWPHQLYVREARRLVGEHVMTEHHAVGREVVEDGIALAAYTMDSHNVQRVVVDGMVKNEGNVEVGGWPDDDLGGAVVVEPYPISYRSLNPKREEVTNLLVPVALSASHIAFGSIRMEPVYMVLGQVAATAAAMAIDADTTVQAVDVRALRRALRENPLADGSTPEVRVDDADTASVRVSGAWTRSSPEGKFATTALRHEGGEAGEVRFLPGIPEAGRYEVYLYWPRSDALSDRVPVVIGHAAGRDTLTLDMREPDAIHGGLQHGIVSWVRLGAYTFRPDGEAWLAVGAAAEGPVYADAALFVPVRDRR